MESETQNTETRSTQDQSADTETAEKDSGPVAMIEKLIARLASAIEMLERAIPQAGISATAAACEGVGPIVAMVEGSNREAELAQKLAEAEKTIAELRASSTSREGRRTLPVSLLAKQDGSAPEPGALDAALLSLSLEQRIAVKAQLLRGGLV